MNDKTVVKFRVFKNPKHSEVIALFPGIPWSQFGRDCASYMHTGQHGAASYGFVMAATRPASSAEFAQLKKELESIGYDLDVKL